jgi:hypothetical protein
MSPRILFAGATARALIGLATIVLAATADLRPAIAASELLAVTGDLQPGSASIQLLGLSAATLNDSGEVAFRATLKPDVGPIDSTNDRAVWKIGATRSLIAQAGVGVAPGGGNFNAFSAVSISDAGEVVLRATTTGGQVGFWRYPPSPAAPAPIAATGATGVPGVPTGQWDSLGFQLLHAPNGVMAFNGRLAVGVGGIGASNNSGVWLDENGAQSLLVRRKLSIVPGVGGATFDIPSATGVNNLGQTAMFGTLTVGDGGVTTADRIGIWRMDSGGGALIVRVNSGGITEPPGASYSSFSEPVINSSGHVAFAAELALIGDVTAANSRGVWLHDGVNGDAIVRSGSPAPGIAAGLFSSFAAPLLNDADQLLVAATLAESVGGVTPQNSQGLWVVESGGGTLLARTGSMNVPDVPGASFTSFGSLAFNELGVAAVQANLSNVAPGADQGLWLLNAEGGGTLVARTGDVVGSRTIASLEFTGGSGGGDGRQRALNSSGQLVYKATFTNGDEGLFLYSPPVTSPADFTADGAVTAADLNKWRLGFGQAAGAGRAQGDADSDGDVDGGDFLLWQRHLGAGISLAAVPEPSLAAVLLPILLVCGLRLNRRA